MPVPQPEANGVTTAVVSICSDDTPTEQPKPCQSPDTCSQPGTVEAVQCDNVNTERVKGLSHRSVTPSGKRNCVYQEMCGARKWNWINESTSRERRNG